MKKIYASPSIAIIAMKMEGTCMVEASGKVQDGTEWGGNIGGDPVTNPSKAAQFSDEDLSLVGYEPWSNE